MKDSDADRPTVPVTRVELRRASVEEICRADDVVRECALLRSLSGPEASRLLGGSVARRFAGKTSIFREGDDGQSVFLVLKGEVRLVGGKVEFGVAQKGEIFGEAELVTSRSERSYSAMASVDVDVIELPPPLLKDLGRSNRALVKLIQQLHLGRREKTKEISDFLNRW